VYDYDKSAVPFPFPPQITPHQLQILQAGESCSLSRFHFKPKPTITITSLGSTPAPDNSKTNAREEKTRAKP
jgi:hypothetical protein